MLLLLAMACWLLLGVPLAVLVAGVSRAGHVEDLARGYVDR